MYQPYGSWTHNITHHLALTRGWGAIKARAHWPKNHWNIKKIPKECNFQAIENQIPSPNIVKKVYVSQSRTHINLQ